jgi:hypothetical protein
LNAEVTVPVSLFLRILNLRILLSLCHYLSQHSYSDCKKLPFGGWTSGSLRTFGRDARTSASFLSPTKALATARPIAGDIPSYQTESSNYQENVSNTVLLQNLRPSVWFHSTRTILVSLLDLFPIIFSLNGLASAVSCKCLAAARHIPSQADIHVTVFSLMYRYASVVCNFNFHMLLQCGSYGMWLD